MCKRLIHRKKTLCWQASGKQMNKANNQALCRFRGLISDILFPTFLLCCLVVCIQFLSCVVFMQLISVSRNSAWVSLSYSIFTLRIHNTIVCKWRCNHNEHQQKKVQEENLAFYFSHTMLSKIHSYTGNCKEYDNIDFFITWLTHFNLMQTTFWLVKMSIRSYIEPIRDSV